MATHLASSQDFVRALKAPSDTDKPSKIQIASHAWNEPAFYVPNKDQVIVDWILTHFLKEKGKESQSNPITDVDHWLLLAEIISPLRKPEDLKRLKTWLVPLLNRIPFVPIAVAFLNFIPSLTTIQRKTLSEPFSRCFLVLWPLATQKVTADALLDSFSAFLDTLSVECKEQEIFGSLTVIGPSITSSYRTSFSNSTNKKKLYTSFIAKTLSIWIRAISLESSDNTSDIYAAGIETIFSVDILRQMTEVDSDNNLFDALSKTDIAILFPALSRLFSSFCELIRKSRGILFGQKHESTPGASLERLRNTGMKFYSSCNNLLQLGDNMPNKVWESRTELLKIVEKENLFTTIISEHHSLLKECSNMIATLMAGHPHDESRIAMLLPPLCVLTSIDYEIVAIDIPVILPALAKTSSAIQLPSSSFLDLLLEYHAKARTVPAHLFNLLASLGANQNIDGARSTYNHVISGSILGLAHLDRLAKIIHNFVTPGQCLEVISVSAEILKETWVNFQEAHEKSKADLGDGARKRRKVDSAGAFIDRPPSQEEILAARFAFMCRLVAVIWPAVPVHLVSEDVRAKLREKVHSLRENVISPGIVKGTKNIGGKSERRGLDTWHWEAVVAAVLRLQYMLTSCKTLQVEVVRDEKAEARMLKALGSDEYLPDLKLEITRFFLSLASLDELTNFEQVFDSLLIQLEGHAQLDYSVQWNGLTFDLSNVQLGKAQETVALLYSLVDRWLPTLEDKANSNQLGRFVRTLIRCGTAGSVPPLKLHEYGLSLDIILKKALRAAEFWELPNLRNAVLAYLSVETSSLDDFDLLQTIQSLEKPTASYPPIDFLQFMACYETLLYTPLEYLSKNVRADLLRRGLSADVLLTRLLHSSNEHDKSKFWQMKTILREFSNRLFSYLNAVEYPAAYEMTEYLIDPRWVNVTLMQERAVGVTLQLVEMHFSSLVKLAEKGLEDGFLKIVKRLIALEIFDSPEMTFGPAVSIKFLNVVTKSALVVRASESVVNSLKTLISHLVKTLSRRLHAVTAAESTFADGFGSKLHVAEAWCRLLALRSLLQIEDEVPQFGNAIVRKILVYETTNPDSHALFGPCKTAISILLAELRNTIGMDRKQRLQVTIAMYVSLYRLCGSDIGALDSTVALACDFLSVEDFSYVLEFSLKMLSDVRTSLQELGPLVRLTAVLLHEAPEGTMKISQKYTSSCLNLFLDRPAFFTESAALVSAILKFISGACGHRPASIKPGDITSIWTILSRLLVGSVSHEDSTSSAVFQEITAIVSALVRLRRDLVLATLPHLGMILRQLVGTIRTVRPQLGGKQSKMITDTFPRWINPAQPLALDDTKTLARLFETLTTKTVIRIYGSAPDIQKAESLARPFGKHASYVLVAYIEAMNDPFCVISSDTRKELSPGLFALCDMLNDHDREALMLSALDVGGKMTMKELWKEYEKQRYVGKG